MKYSEYLKKIKIKIKKSHRRATAKAEKLL